MRCQSLGVDDDMLLMPWLLVLASSLTCGDFLQCILYARRDRKESTGEVGVIVVITRVIF